MRKLKPDWHKLLFGIALGSGTDARITNLRFADDLMLISRTQHQISTMLGELQQVALRYGLQLHPEKTKIITNATKKLAEVRANTSI